MLFNLDKNPNTFFTHSSMLKLLLN